MRERYKVLHVTSELIDHCAGGVYTVVDSLYRKRNNDEAFLWVTDKYDDFFEIEKNVFCIKNKTFKEITSFPFDDPELIFFHHFYHECGPNLKLNSKKIAVIHGIQTVEFEKNMLKDENLSESFFRCCDNADEIVVVSKSEIKNMQKTLIKHNKKIKRITHIYNGIEKPIFTTNEIKRNKKIGFIGRYDLRKGLIPTTNQFIKIPEYKMYVAGGGASMWNIDSAFKMFVQVVKFSKSTNVIPIGNVSENRKTAFFNNMEAIIIPSTYEPFGMTVLESIYYGKVIFANKTGGIFEILGEDYPFYFDPFCEGDLKRCIDLYENTRDEEIINLINNNYKILDKFSLEKMVNNYRNYSFDNFWGYIQYGINLI